MEKFNYCLWISSNSGCNHQCEWADQKPTLLSTWLMYSFFYININQMNKDESMGLTDQLSCIPNYDFGFIFGSVSFGWIFTYQASCALEDLAGCGVTNTLLVSNISQWCNVLGMHPSGDAPTDGYWGVNVSDLFSFSLSCCLFASKSCKSLATTNLFNKGN